MDIHQARVDGFPLALPADSQIPASNQHQLSSSDRSSLDRSHAAGPLQKVASRTTDVDTLHDARTDVELANAIYASAEQLVPMEPLSIQAQQSALHKQPQSSELVYHQVSDAGLMLHKHTLPGEQVTCNHESLVRRHDDNHFERSPDVPKRAGISRSTYFRAKRNLRSIGSVKTATTGKQIGRPQKLDANAEKLIQETLAKQPATELKQLQQLVLDHCQITVSLSSISRRLKALGCSPSQNSNHSKRPYRTNFVESSSTDHQLVPGVDDINDKDKNSTAQVSSRRMSDAHQQQTEHIDQDLASAHDLRNHGIQQQATHHLSEHDRQMQQDLQDLENYHNISDLEADLGTYDSPGMDLNMLQDMQNLDTDYTDLDPSKMGVVHGDNQLYEYENYPSDDKDDALYHSPDLAHTLYQHSHPPQMLYHPDIDPSLM